MVHTCLISGGILSESKFHMGWHDTKPVLGWTLLSRKEMRQVERSLANNEQDTRDEIGFLLIHQGFADRFFLGTSVLHTRVRYALFVPWLGRG